VLDAVLADANDLRRRICTSASEKSMNTGVGARRRATHRKRGQERRVARLAAHSGQAQHPASAGWHPQDIGEHMRLMADILVLGFQTDTTRITTLN